MSREIEQAVNAVLEQERRGDYARVDASGLRDDVYKKLLSDLDKLGADYKVSADQTISVKTPGGMSERHAILTLFRYNDLEVRGL